MRIDPFRPAPTRSPARAEAPVFNPTDPAQLAALAQHYAPVRYLHPDEQYGPGDPNAFIRNSEVREHRAWRPDRTPDGFDRGQIDPARLTSLKGDNYYMDLADTEAARRANPNAPSFYQYDEKTKTLTYWNFYNYNDAPGPGKFDHEGDWERITVQFDAAQQPTEVRYSAHGGHQTVPWKDAPKENGRPVAYVAKGSHALSPTTGKKPTGTVPGVNDSFERGQRIDDAQRPLRNITSESWYDTQVHWGQRGKLAVIGQTFTSGPRGPGKSKGPLL